MGAFLNSISVAASSPLALVAYAISAVLFLFAGAKLIQTRLLLSKIETLPDGERRRALEIATDNVVPNTISPEQWIRVKRQRWTFLLLGAVLIAALTVSVIALLNPTAAALGDLKEVTEQAAEKNRSDIRKSEESTAIKIDEATHKIVTTVEDSALANLETMFPLSVRIERDVDGTIVHLNGEPRQQIVSFDRNLQPMQLHWGDRFHYFAFGPPDNLAAAKLSLEVRGQGAPIVLPLDLGSRTEQVLRVPGSSPQPMGVYILNETRTGDISLKITVYSSDRERGREDFLNALMNTSLDSAARRIYREVERDNVRLRNAPSENSQVLRSLRAGTYVRVKSKSEDGQWCQIRLPEGREGWTSCDFLASIAN